LLHKRKSAAAGWADATSAAAAMITGEAAVITARINRMALELALIPTRVPIPKFAILCGAP
jgi:hypothetical protein